MNDINDTNTNCFAQGGICTGNPCHNCDCIESSPSSNSDLLERANKFIEASCSNPILASSAWIMGELVDALTDVTEEINLRTTQRTEMRLRVQAAIKRAEAAELGLTYTEARVRELEETAKYDSARGLAVFQQDQARIVDLMKRSYSLRQERDAAIKRAEAAWAALKELETMRELYLAGKDDYNRGLEYGAEDERKAISVWLKKDTFLGDGNNNHEFILQLIETGRYHTFKMR